MRKNVKTLIVAAILAAVTVVGGVSGLGMASAEGGSESATSTAFSTTSLVTTTGATVTAAQDKTGTGDSAVSHKGLLIAPATTGGVYTGSINGVFPKGSTAIQWSSPGTSDQAVATNIYFKFTDLVDATKYFTVEYSQNGWYTGAAVKDSAGHYRATNYYNKKSILYNKKSILEKKEVNGGDSTHNSLVFPHIGQKNSKVSSLYLDWGTDGVLEVSTTGNSVDKYPIAKFDSDTYASSNGANEIYGLEKLAFTNGFTIEFGISATASANDILLEKITTKTSGGGRRGSLV